LVKDLLNWLAERGFGEVETITATEEHLLFAIPPELRKDIKAAHNLSLNGIKHKEPLV
jgi:4-hydroxy-3-methylbut-2-enyl diphosphate reductase